MRLLISILFLFLSCLTGLLGRSFTPDPLEHAEDDLHGRGHPLRHQLLQLIRVRVCALPQQREDLLGSCRQLVVDHCPKVPARNGFRSFFRHFE